VKKTRLSKPALRRLAMERVAVRLSRLLPDKHALIGGLAVGIHGYVRATKDVDFVVLDDPIALRERLKQAGVETELRRGDVLEGDIPWVLFGKLDGVRFDLLAPTVPIDWDRRERVLLGVEELLAVDVSTLIRLKLRAGGSLDLIDLVHLLRAHPEEREKALEVASAYRLRERLAASLADRTLRTDEEEQREPPPTSRGTGGRRARR
jgi:hypothetical protein